MTSAATVKIPAPKSDTHVEVGARLYLGAALEGFEVTYDYDRAYGSIYLRVLNKPEHGIIADRMRAGSGVWLAVCSVDESGLHPVDVEIDFDGVEDVVGPLATVVPVVLEAIAVFYDSDETATLHRRALRAFYRGLSATLPAA